MWYFVATNLAIDDDYIQVAQFSNICRSNVIQGSPVDFLICVVAFRLKAPIYISENDFYLYQKHIPIKLL